VRMGVGPRPQLPTCAYVSTRRKAVTASTVRFVKISMLGGIMIMGALEGLRTIS
jgi:hypothetical protein